MLFYLSLETDRASRSEQRDLGLVPGSGEAIPTEEVCYLPREGAQVASSP